MEPIQKSNRHRITEWFKQQVLEIKNHCLNHFICMHKEKSLALQRPSEIKGSWTLEK